MSGSNPPINRIIVRQPRQHRRQTRRVPPIPHQITNDREKTNELHARASHPVIGNVSDEFRRGARRLDIGPDAIALSAEREGAESCAHVGRDAGDDDLRPIRRSHSGAEVGVVPGVHFALAGYQGSVGVPLPCCAVSSFLSFSPRYVG